MKPGDTYRIPDGVERGGPNEHAGHTVTVFAVMTHERDPDVVDVRCECGIGWQFDDVAGSAIERSLRAELVKALRETTYGGSPSETAFRNGVAPRPRSSS